MNKAIDKSNLGYLGADYQYRLVKCFIEEPRYFQETNSIVDQNVFTEPLLKRLVGVLKDYYSTNNGVMPSYQTISSLIKSKYAKLESDIEECDEVIKKLQTTSFEGCDFVMENATRFFKQQYMVKIAQTILNDVKEGNDEGFTKSMEDISNVINLGNADDDGFNPYDIEDEVMRPNSMVSIPTGINGLDTVLNGGLDKGKLGVVVGPAGFGKTSFGTAVASYASTYRCPTNNEMGYKVIQFVFEDDPRDISKKHFARISQIEAKDLTKPAMLPTAKRLIDDFGDKEIFKQNLIVKKYKPNGASVETLKKFIKKKINQGFKPDLIVVDYFEPIKKERKNKSATKWEVEEDCMRELEVLAEEFDVAEWVFTQGNKESFTANFVNMSQAGGSVTKVQVGHVILSIARDMEGQRDNKATIAILKSRQGGSGTIWEGVKFNNGTSTISCDEVIEFNDAIAYQEYSGNNETIDNQQNTQPKTTNGKAPIKKKPFVSKAEYAKQQSSNKLAMEAEEWENDL